MNLLTCAKYEENLRSPITKYIGVKKLEEWVLECPISTATKKRQIQSLKYKLYSFSFSIIVTCMLRFVSAVFSSLCRGVLLYDTTTSTSTGSMIFFSPFRPFVIG